MPQNTRVTVGLETYNFYNAEHHRTEDKLTNMFASRDKMTGDAPIARTGLALCHRVILHSEAHCWVPVPLRREAVGGPQPASHDTTNTKRPRLQRPALVTNKKHQMDRLNMHIVKACVFTNLLLASIAKNAIFVFQNGLLHLLDGFFNH